MAIPKSARSPITYEQYLEVEGSSDVRNEYRDGELVAMAGGSYEHSLIIANLVGTLTQVLKGKACRVLESNMKVLNVRRNQGTYPDAMIVCGAPEFALKGKDRSTILNPRVIIEVLSPSTERYDRTVKFDLYSEIASVDEYVLVESIEPRVVSHCRLVDGGWKLDRAIGPSARARILCLGVELSLADVYANVDFPESADSGTQS